MYNMHLGKDFGEVISKQDVSIEAPPPLKTRDLFGKKRQKTVKAKVDRRFQGSFTLQTQQYWYANKITETKAVYTRPENIRQTKPLHEGREVGTKSHL